MATNQYRDCFSRRLNLLRGGLLPAQYAPEPSPIPMPPEETQQFNAMARFWKRFGLVEDNLRMLWPLVGPLRDPTKHLAWDGVRIIATREMLGATPERLETALDALIDEALDWAKDGWPRREL
jgi:hypothetical protein